MNLVQFLDLALSTDMIIIYALIFLMAILLIVIFSIDAKNKKKNLNEEIVIEGTVPLEEYKLANHLQKKVEQKIKELEDQQVKEQVIEEKVEENIPEKEETIKKEVSEESTIHYEEEKTEEEVKEEAKEQLNEVALSLIDDPGEDAVKLTNFEIEQEENAIISYNELVKVSDDLYEKNEVTQYADEGNEPITLDQLRLKFEDQPTEEKEDKKAEVVTENSESSLVEAIDALIKENNQDIGVEVVATEKPKVKLNDFIELDKKQVAFDIQRENKFQTSPIISPIYGIKTEEEIRKETELELEQTADLEKLDAELRKTNEFLQLLKELQKKLD